MTTVEDGEGPAEQDHGPRLIELATEVVAAFVTHNSVPASELPVLLRTVHASLDRMRAGRPPEAPVEAPQPAVPIKRSVTDEYLICLEDGRKFRSLKRHLQSAFGLTPEQYRAKWGLPRDYPMVAPAYASKRSELARRIGLGRKPDA